MVAGVERDDAPHPAERIREMLTFVDPNLPYRDFIAVVMAVRSQYPDDEGYALVDEWSTDARENNDQQTVARDPGLFWRTEPHSISYGTLDHYATLGGWEPPSFDLVSKTVPEPIEEPAAPAVEYPPLTLEEMPLYLREFVQYLSPVTQAWPHDWAEMLALTGLSALFPNIKFDGLGLNLWLLAIAPQGVGKGRSGDVTHDTVMRLATEVGIDMKAVTRATGEGYARILSGYRQAAYVWHEEYGALMADFGKEHMKGIKQDLCSLYDGRKIAYHRSKDSVEASEPYMVKVAMIQPRAFLNGVDRDDLYNGYLSRFLFCLPNGTVTEMGSIPKEAQDRMVNLLREPLLARQTIHKAQWRQHFFSTIPDAFTAYKRSIIPTEGQGFSFESAIYEEQAEVAWRLLARVMKVAALLDLLSEAPDVRDGVLHVTDGATALAVRLVARGASYARRVAVLAGGDALGRQGTNLLRWLRRPEWAGGMTRRNINRHVGISYPDQARLLPDLQESGMIAAQERGKAKFYVYTGGQ